MNQNKNKQTMTTSKFITDVVKIDYLDDYKAYGHFPFHLYVINKDDKNEMVTLSLGGNVKACYASVKKYIRLEAKKLFMSLDFSKPENDEIIKTDFVAIFSYVGGKIGCVIIPYDAQTGKTFKIITEAEIINILIENFTKEVL